MEVLATLRKIRDSGEKVMVVGLGVSGVETLLFFERLGIPVLALEKTSADLFFSKNPRAEAVRGLIARGLDVQWGIDGREFSGNPALAIVSPGVSLDSALIRALEERNVPCLSEIELGITLFRAPYIVVTGSNGKSTTVSLLHHILQESGRSSFLCGNVGVPVVSELGADILDRAPTHVDYLVVEASSYQLEGCHHIKPKVGLFLNLTENHLERHKTMERYAGAKSRLFAQQDRSDFAILNIDDAWARNLGQDLQSQVYWFGKGQAPGRGARIAYDPGAGLDSVELYGIGDSSAGAVEHYALGGLPLLGLHNRYNVAAAICAARVIGVEPALLRRALMSFLPLTHRIEPVELPREAAESANAATHPMVLNDSKSTTVAASVEAARTVLDHFRGRPVVLLLGGQAKAGSWAPLAALVEEHRNSFRALVFFGRDGGLVHDALRREGLKAAIQTFREKTLYEATAVALKVAEECAVVLLSPGCASFDEFTDFEQRGERFKEFVRELWAAPSSSSEQGAVPPMT